MIDKTKEPYIIEKRNGEVTLRDFDVGLMNRLGFTLKRLTSPEFVDVSLFTLDFTDNIPRGVVVIPGINSKFNDTLTDEVNIVMNNPEFIYTLELLPTIVIRRETLDFDGSRALGQSEISYRIGADNAEVLLSANNLVKGFSRLEERILPQPVDIFYSIEMFGRFRLQTNLIFKHVYNKLKNFGGIIVKDSEGDNRFYNTVFQGFSEISEVVDTGQRIMGYNLVMIVKAELDADEPVIQKTVKDIQINFESL